MNKGMMAGIAVVIIVVLAGGAYMFMNQNKSAPAVSVAETTIVDESMESTDEAMMEDNSGDSQVDESSTVEDSMEEAREITVEGFSFGYTPSELTMEAGEKIKLTFVSLDMMHDFIVEGTDIQTEIITGGNQTTIEFTAPDEPGEYTFYCSVGNHRAQGMEGTLTVE
jgi:plastocyanin